MKLLKPHWVSHDGNPIYSLSIHPDGSRIATGGQGKDNGIVVIWNTDPIKSEESEQNVHVPKMLCELTNHLGCVNCVKWSRDGKWLASSGDDAIIMLWSLRHKGLSAPAFGSDKPTHEQWGCGFMLRGHSGDVFDISWSQDHRYLASASVDNTIIVWNALKLPEQVATLTNHTGLVKGLAWDPVGKYLASQSDDKSVRIWRTTDWKEEAKVIHPFENCGGTTHVLRLSWSPDGRFIVSAHSLNNDGPTAHIIERSTWKTGIDFVGHRKAIEVVSFNPHLFAKGESTNHGCIAIGSRDRSVSVWLTSLKRPLVVVHDLFNNSVLDLAWSEDGYTLMACSLDGTCAYLSFTKKELGVQLGKEAINDMFVDLYGTKRFVQGKLTDEPMDVLVEDPAMLAQTHLNQLNDLIGKPATKCDILSTPSKHLSVQNGSVLSQQEETRTKDGRRRIKPITLTSDPGYIPLQNSSFSSPQTIIHTPPKKKETPQLNQSLLSSAMGTTVTTTAVNVSPSQAKPISFAPLSPDQPKEKRENKNQSLSAAKAIVTGSKRTSTSQELVCDSVNFIKTKRIKKMRSVDDSAPTIKTSTTKSSSSHKSVSLVTNLPSPTLELSFSTKITFDDTTSTIEANNIATGGCTIACIQNDTVTWNVSFVCPALLLAGSHFVTCVGLEDCSIAFLSSLTGRLLFPRIMSSCLPYCIFVSSHFVGVAVTNATLSVYDTSSFSAILNNVSFSHLFSSASDLKTFSIIDDGLPVIATDKQVYCYNRNMQAWIELVGDSEHSIVRSSKFTMSSTVTELTPLRSLQHSVGFSSFSTSSLPSRSATLSYLEAQIGRSTCLRSVLECQHWVKWYVRYLVSESLEDRLREFMLSLFGGTEQQPSSSFSVANYCTPLLLKECLSLITTNTKLQRLYCELRDSAAIDN